MVGRGWSVRIATVAVVMAAAVATLPLGAPSAYAATSRNLIKNGGAERSAGSTDGSIVPVPAWTETTGTTFTAVQYGASGGFPQATDPGPKNRGKNFFAGGPGDGTVVASQTDSLKTYATAIAGGGVTFTLSGFLGGFSGQNDQASIEIDFKNRRGFLLSSATIGPVTAADRNGLTGLIKRVATGSVPVGSVKVLVQMSLVRTDGTYNDGYADSLSLTLSGV